MRSPASSARSSRVAICSAHYTAKGGLENTSDCEVAVDDCSVTVLQPAGAAKAHIGGEDVAKDHLCAHFRPCAGMEVEGVGPGVAQVAEERAVKAADHHRERPGAGLHGHDREAVFGGGERVLVAG